VNRKSSPQPSDEAAVPVFEEALSELEKIVHRLEGGEISLNEALTDYEQGVKLLRQCYQLLEKAERKIELLSGVDAEGNPVSTPLDDKALSLQEKADRRSQRRTTQTSKSPPDKGAEDRSDDMDVPGGLF